MEDVVRRDLAAVLIRPCSRKTIGIPLAATRVMTRKEIRFFQGEPHLGMTLQEPLQRGGAALLHPDPQKLGRGCGIAPPSGLGLRSGIPLAQGHAFKVHQKGGVAMLRARKSLSARAVSGPEMIENGSRGGRLNRANKQLGVIATLRLHHDLPLLLTQTETAGMRIARPREAD